VSFPHSNQSQQTISRTNTENSSPQAKTKKQPEQNRRPRTNPPKEKNESNPGPQGVPLCVPVDPWLTNMVTQSAKIKSPRYQNGASRPPRLKFGINKIIHVSNQPVSSYLFTQGTGQQGRILMIYVYDSPTPHTASPPRPAPSPQQQKNVERKRRS
jgi:hypothetical protein